MNYLNTGFAELDNILKGLHNGELIFVASRPAMGKTSFALNIAHHLAINNKIPVVMFTLEDSKELIISRMVTIDSNIDYIKRKHSKIDKKEEIKVSHSEEKIKNSPFYIDDSIYHNFTELIEKARWYKKEYNEKLIIIDYIQLLMYLGVKDECNDGIEIIMSSLKNIATELDIPIMILSQVPRGVERKRDCRPSLNDVNSYEQHADTIIFIYRDDYYNEYSEWPGIAEIIVAKQLSGATGVVELKWNSRCLRFYNKREENE